MKYKEAGVDIEKADFFKKFIKNKIKEIGGFSGLFPIPDTDYLIAASVDGVGTKLKIAQKLGIHNTVGQDIVNHCVNDIICCGATPIFFMDYIAMGKLIPEIAKDIVEGIIKACEENNLKLLGGETAEMPGFYNEGEYELVGFITGLVKKNEIIDGSKIKEGDAVIGLKSSGLHTNGYSLVRKIIADKNIALTKYFEEFGCTIGEELLKIHKSYLKEFLKVKKYLKGIAHITGGGFYGNIPRILPENLSCRIRVNWEIPPVFKFIEKEGNVEKEEMFRVFNMGIGIVFVVDKEDKDKVLSKLRDAILIGEIIKGEKNVIICD